MPLVATADVIDTGGIGAGAGVVVMGADAGIAVGVGRMREITAITSAAAARTATINAVQENRARRGAGCCGEGLPVSGSTAAQHPARRPVVDSFTQRKTSPRQRHKVELTFDPPPALHAHRWQSI